MLDSTEELERVLRALEERLRHTGSTPLDLVVCGGAGLFAMRWMTRTVTKDVDVLAILEKGPDGPARLRKSRPLPPLLLEQARIVGDDFGLPEGWLNPGPTDLLDAGLPVGFEERLHAVRYGPALTVHFAGRADQICFKLYATVDQGPDSRHVGDLRALSPDPGEMETAARWALTQDPSEGFRVVLLDCLSKLGFSDVARAL